MVICVNRGKGKIAELLHHMFSEEAIECAALSEKLEDVRYLKKHNLLHDEKLKQMYNKCIILGDKDGKKTLNDENTTLFRKKINSLLTKNNKLNLYDGLTEMEEFAFRCFYYSGY